MASGTSRIMGMAFLVTGSIVGAGILALPVKTGLAGFIPSMLGLVVLWLLMTITALIIAGQKSLQAGEASDLPSLFGDALGPVGMWVAILGNMVIFYGLMVAYLSGAASVIHDLTGGALPMWLSMLLFFTLVTAVALFGINAVTKGNAVLMILMWSAFAFMLVLALKHADVEKVKVAHWEILPAALPVILTSCNFHFVIPSICRAMNFDRKGITIAICIGTTLAMLMNACWMLAVTGVLPLTGPGGDVTPGTLLYTFQHNLPATIPLDTIINSESFMICSSMFALVAISTSYLTCCTALVGFCGDLTHRIGLGGRRWAVWGLSFAPPVAVALIEPDIFLKALDVVGGVGIGILFGLLPGILLFKQAKAAGKGWVRPLAAVLILCFAFVLVCELAQEAGMMHLDADVESWAMKPPVK